MVYKGVLNTIVNVNPRAILLENVANIASEHCDVVKDIISTLVENKYVVETKTLCPRSFGYPQARPRWYLVARRRDSCRTEFEWPKPVPLEPDALEKLLDPVTEVSTPVQRAQWPPANRHVGESCRRRDYDPIASPQCVPIPQHGSQFLVIKDTPLFCPLSLWQRGRKEHVQSVWWVPSLSDLLRTWEQYLLLECIWEIPPIDWSLASLGWMRWSN